MKHEPSVTHINAFKEKRYAKKANAVIEPINFDILDEFAANKEAQNRRLGFYVVGSEKPLIIQVPDWNTNTPIDEKDTPK